MRFFMVIDPQSLMAISWGKRTATTDLGKPVASPQFFVASHQKCFPEYVGNSIQLLSLRFINGLLTIGLGFTPKDLLSTRFVGH